MYVSDCLFFSILLLLLLILGLITINDHFTTHDWEKSHHRTLRNRLEDGIKSVDVVKVKNHACCMARTKVCMACEMGITVASFCEKIAPLHEEDFGCVDTTHPTIMIGIPLHNRKGYVKFHSKVLRQYNNVNSKDIFIFDDASTEYDEVQLRKWYGKDIHYFRSATHLKADKNTRRLFTHFAKSNYDILLTLDSDLILDNQWKQFIYDNIYKSGVLSLYHSGIGHHKTFNCNETICQKQSMGNAGTVMKKSIVIEMLKHHKSHDFDWGWVAYFKNRGINMYVPKNSLVLHYGKIGENNACDTRELAKGFNRSILPSWIRLRLYFYFDKCSNPSTIFNKKKVEKMLCFKKNSTVKKISVRAGKLIDSITFYDENNTVLCKAGGDGGDLKDDFILNDDEYIVKIIQKYGDSLDSVVFHTNTERSKKYGGDGGSFTQDFIVSENEMIVGLERSTNFCGKIIKVHAIETNKKPAPNVTSKITTKAHIKIKKPIIAICAATRSVSNWKTVKDTSLQTLMIPSIEKTVSVIDRNKYKFHLYLAADHDDNFWLKNKHKIQVPKWLSLHFYFFEGPEHKIPFNKMMRQAYEDGAEYMVRINDDSQFITSDWVSEAVKTLASYVPPNVGMVGPNCKEGNTGIMTHDMVHRTHLKIFPNYYPDVFSAWYIDDWITYVYGKKRSTKIMNWIVKHHIHKHGTRYSVNWSEQKLLQGEISKGKLVVEKWLKRSEDPKTKLVADTYVSQVLQTTISTKGANDGMGHVLLAKPIIFTVVSSSMIEMAMNWWHYLSPYSESISVHITGLSKSICQYFRGKDVICTDAENTEDDLTEDVTYKTRGYLQNVKRKLYEYSRFLESVPMGTTVLLSDVDVVFLSNPFDAINTDKFKLGFSGGSKGKNCHALLNTGVFFVVKTVQATALFKHAIENLNIGSSYDGTDQGAIQAAVNKLKLKYFRLPCDTFVNGNGLFTIKTLKTPVSIHMNWIVKSSVKKQCFEACRLWMGDAKEFRKADVTLLPSGQISRCSKII
mgnify:CR=1 FL=1